MIEVSIDHQAQQALQRYLGCRERPPNVDHRTWKRIRLGTATEISAYELRHTARKYPHVLELLGLAFLWQRPGM